MDSEYDTVNAIKLRQEDATTNIVNFYAYGYYSKFMNLNPNADEIQGTREIVPAMLMRIVYRPGVDELLTPFSSPPSCP